MWDKEDYKDKIKKYLESLSLNIADVDITTKDFDEAELPDDMPKAMKNRLAKSLKGNQSYTVIAKHTLYDSNAKPTPNLVSWEWWEKESAGSKKAFELSGPILWTLANGGVLIIDEIEAKMYPAMTLNTIDIFLDPASNPNKWQKEVL